MSRNKEIRADRIFMLIFIIILILSVLGFGGYFAINLLKDKLNKPEEIVDSKNNQKEESEKISIKLNDYTVYIDDSNELGFSFVICNIDVTTNKDKLSLINTYLKHMEYGIAFKNGMEDKEKQDATFYRMKDEMRELGLKSKDIKKYIEELN